MANQWHWGFLGGGFGGGMFPPRWGGGHVFPCPPVLLLGSVADLFPWVGKISGMFFKPGFSKQHHPNSSPPFPRGLISPPCEKNGAIRAGCLYFDPPALGRQPSGRHEAKRRLKSGPESLPAFHGQQVLKATGRGARGTFKRRRGDGGGRRAAGPWGLG